MHHRLPQNLQKIFDLFPQNEKETLENYLFRLRNHALSLEKEFESKKYLKLHFFLSKINTKKGDKKMNMALLESELVPKNGNLYKAKNKKRTLRPATTEKAFEILNPLENAQSFVKYYRRLIKNTNPNVKFAEGAFESECRFATKIIDDLILNNRDEKFLRMWIYNYLNNSLKGDNIEKVEKTSIHSFGKTFEIFNMSYFG